jgi:hypothetical protein
MLQALCVLDKQHAVALEHCGHFKRLVVCDAGLLSRYEGFGAAVWRTSWRTGRSLHLAHLDLKRRRLTNHCR